MKNIVFAAAFGVALLSSGAAFAERWAAPINGALSTIMVPNGDVVMKIQLPPAEYEAITGMMAKSEKSCTMFPTSEGRQTSSLILVCGPTREYIPNY